MTLPNLIGLQTQVLYMSDNQSLFIKGSAGSGKSLLALYRVYWLAKVHPNENTLLLTFNKAVNVDMQNKLKQIAFSRNEEVPSNLLVYTYHQFMRKVLKKLWNHFGSSLEGLSKYIKDDNGTTKVRLYNSSKLKTEIIEKALEETRKKYPEEVTLQRPVTVFFDEISWIQRMAIKDEEEYYEADRIGRQGTRIERAKRHYFYEVYKLYIEKRESDEYLAFCDFDDIGTIIRNLLDNCPDNQFIENVLKLNHIVIDEFQDFSSDMLMTMNKLLKEKGTLMLLGDIKQGVFGKRISFKSLGIELNKYKNFELEFNYRNTKEISDLAEIIVNSEYFDKTNELYSKTIKGARKGRVPKIYKYKDENAELAEIVRYIKDYLNKHYESVSVGIIVPTSKFNNTKTYLESRQIKVNNFNEISNDKQKNKVYFGTYKQVKGLEFDVVLMPFMNRENFLSQARSYNEELDIDDDIGLEDIDADILEIELAQLYVGVTRARNELFITTTGELTPLLPSETFKQYIFEGSN